MELEYKSLPFEVKAKNDGSAFEGWASTFHNIDDSFWNDIICPGAFKQDLPYFLESGFIGLGHDWAEPIGSPKSAEERDMGLYIEGSISATTRGNDAKILIKDKVIKALSIGFQALGRKFLENAEEVAKYWAEAGYSPTPDDVAKSKYGARLLTRIRVFETSLVSIGANARARITAVKAGLPDGLPYEEHLATALAAVRSATNRTDEIRALRAVDGRAFSVARYEQLVELQQELNGLVAATAPRVPEEKRLAAAAQFARTQAAVRLALYSETAAGAKS